jgi:2-polyprenyl-6-methoxyphenol hydroxylase-like FAD-dependent oxidoreductase
MDILISGASVAGPSLAYWLNRHGHTTTIVERAPHLRGGGYAVDFRGHVHLGILDQMGVLDAIRDRQTHMGDLIYVDGDDRDLARMPSGVFSGDVEILRGDLAEVLYAATRDRTDYLFGDEITALDDGDVTFAGGGRGRFDLVIGADGVHSGVRRLAFGNESRFIRDLGMYVAIYTVPSTYALSGTGRLYSTPGRTASVMNQTAVFYFRSTASMPPTVEAQRALLRTEFAGAGWRCDALLAEMDSASDFYFDTTSQIVMDRWSTGRVALIGDAGYAAGPGGNGTGTAVVAAYVLAGELARAANNRGSAFDWGSAFAAYEKRMRPYVAKGQKQAAGGADFLAPASWKQIKQRNRFFRMMRYLPVNGLITRIATKTATAIELPAYDPAPATTPATEPATDSATEPATERRRSGQR